MELEGGGTREHETGFADRLVRGNLPRGEEHTGSCEKEKGKKESSL